MSKAGTDWEPTELGRLGEYLNGAAFKPTDWGDAGTPIIRIQNLTDPSKPLNRTTRVVSDRLRVENGDILVSWSATLDAFIWDRGRAWLNQHIFRVLPNDALVDKRFLFFLLKKEIAELIETEHLHGSTMKHINRGPFLSHKVLLPKIPQQRLIVTKLDSLFAKSKAAREELRRVPKLIERYKQAVLASAFRGELTAKWHAASPAPSDSLEEAVNQVLWEIPNSWNWKPVAQAGVVSLGRQRSPENHEGPFMRPYVRAANITWGGWDLSGVKEMNFDERDFARFHLKVGDVLINEGSGSAKEVGKPAIWNGEVKNCCFQNTLIRFRPVSCTSEYAYFYFLYCAMSLMFVSSTQGVNIYHIGKDGLARFPMPCAPIDEQKEIVRSVKTAFEKIQNAARQIERSSELADRLDKAILASAFRGELIDSSVSNAR